MNIKNIWTNSDFEEMGWHDNRIYKITFPNKSFNFSLYLDYIFDWDRTNSKCLISPCELVFENVSNLKVNLDFQDTSLLFINEIKRSESKPSINNKTLIWYYDIGCDIGTISFNSTGFKQVVIKPPILSESIYLNSFDE